MLLWKGGHLIYTNDNTERFRYSHTEGNNLFGGLLERGMYFSTSLFDPGIWTVKAAGTLTSK